MFTVKYVGNRICGFLAPKFNELMAGSTTHCKLTHKMSMHTGGRKSRREEGSCTNIGGIFALLTRKDM